MIIHTKNTIKPIFKANVNDEFLLDHLEQWVPLFYGSHNANHAISYKKKGYFYFGYDNGDVRVVNRITKPLAIYLAIGKMRMDKRQKKKCKRKRQK